MPRNGAGIWTQPSNTRAVSGDPIASDKYNTLIDDIAGALNDAVPPSRGGTGATSLGAAVITPPNVSADSLANHLSAALFPTPTGLSADSLANHLSAALFPTPTGLSADSLADHLGAALRPTPTNGTADSLADLLEGVQASNPPALPMILRVDTLPFVSPTWWGFTPLPTGDATTNAAALLAAIEFAITYKKPVQLPAGEFPCGHVSFEVDNFQSIKIVGAGRYATKLLASDAAGLITITPTRINAPPAAGATSIHLEGFGLYVNRAVCAHGIYIDQSALDGETSVLGAGVSVVIRDMGSSYYATNSHLFSSVLRFWSVTGALVSNCHFFGPIGTPTGVAINFDGDNSDGQPNGVDNRVRDCFITRFGTGIDWSMPGEGFQVSGCTIQACQNGVVAEWQAVVGQETQPQLFVSDCHINCSSRGVYAVNWNDVRIHGNLIYVTGPGVGIEATRPDATTAVSATHVVENILRVVSTGSTATAIKLNANIGIGRVDQNTMTSFGKGVELLGGTRDLRGDNQAYATTTPLTDAGSSNAVTVESVAAYA